MEAIFRIDIYHKFFPICSFAYISFKHDIYNMWANIFDDTTSLWKSYNPLYIVCICDYVTFVLDKFIWDFD